MLYMCCYAVIDNKGRFILDSLFNQNQQLRHKAQCFGY